MKKMASFRLFFFFFFFLFLLFQPSKSDESCPNGCGTAPIRFPFQMTNSLPEDRCGYHGFTVKCQNDTQSIITFPSSGDFRIENISYSSQQVRIYDPRDCIAKRFLQGFNYSDTPFQPLCTRNFTFLNCTSDDAPIFQRPGASPIPCLSSETYYVVALPTDRVSVSNTSSCMEISTFSYPSQGPDDSSDSIGDFITLSWKEPDCRRCESIGGICQFKDDISLDVGCFEPLDPEFTANARYAAVFVVASGLCIIGFIILIRRRIKSHSQGQLPGTEISAATNPSQSENAFAKGLDRPKIETYPTTLVGESLQLPKPTDNVCPICLLDYKANDVLRTIPTCMHYFHVDCIDEWLKRSATCPLCRN